MTDKKKQPDTAAELRRQAEEKLRQEDSLVPKSFLGLSPEEISQKLHELRVHQIELEMQNEELRRTQEELGDSRARYFDLYDFAPVGYITVSLKGFILNANLTFANMLSTERSNVINKPLTDFIIFEDQDIFYNYRRELLGPKIQNTCELRLRNKEGTPFYVQLENKISLNKSKTQKQFRIIVIDICERKLVEEALVLEKNSLQEALLNVKELSGLLPICAHCKKIRDDKGYWNLLESYIEKHSNASFSHGMCPECMEDFYGKEDWYMEGEKEEE
jgi:PAS domain S-box-containing protein